MIKRFTLLIVIFVTLNSTDLFSQRKSEIKSLFYEAESWILYEDYREALPSYIRLLEYYPENDNIRYRIGQCYINIPGEKERAVDYLEEAVRNINPKYREGKFRETAAPYDALYYLANAYRITNQLDKAIDTYSQFILNMDHRIYDSVIVNHQIKSCYAAKELMSNPMFIKEKNLGRIINGDNSEYNSVASDDENILIFSRTEPFYDALLFSRRNKDRWEEPVNMNAILKIDRYIYPTSLSHDGKTLLLYNSADYDGNIFSTTNENGAWSPVVKLNDNINTKYWESHATLSQDNNKLYFSSNRKGGYGGLDIYVSTRDNSGNWGPAINLGPVINTPYNEDTPFLCDDDRTLYFSSRGHFNMGGYDIFCSNLNEEGEWTSPVNLGYPVNTTDDDLFFKPVKNGNSGYFAKYNPDGFGGQDIYRIEIFSDDNPREFFVTGKAKVSGINSIVKISAQKKEAGEETLDSYTNPETGNFNFTAHHGNYDLVFESEDSEPFRTSFTLPLFNPSDTFFLTDVIMTRIDNEAILKVNSENEIRVDDADTLFFPVDAEPGSLLYTEHWNDGSLISSEEHNTTDSSYTYIMTPLPGENRIIFSLTDPSGNIATSEVIVSQKTPAGKTKKEYKELTSERQQEITFEKMESKKAESVEIIQETETTVTEENADTAEPDIYPEGKKSLSSLWWLLVAAGLMFFFLIIFRRKKKNDNK